MADKVTVQAPAKINLILEVLGKRSDGFHEIRSVMQSVDLYDTLTFTPSNETEISCDMPGWSPDQSLVGRAVKAIKEKTGYTAGVSVNITKEIPLMSGLGGDSSDAVAVLKGLNELWELNLPPDDLTVIAAALGSDVVFFLKGGTALATGRGEITMPLPTLRKMWLVLVVPDIPEEPGKTARMYRSLTTAHYTDGKMSEKLVEAIKRGERVSESMLFNTFENIAFDSNNIRRVYVEHLEKLGAPRVHLTGSGPALFVVFDKQDTAEDFHIRCKDQGMRVYNIATGNS